ncbi:MAG TPA: polysaccharide deacetylase family protein [Anaerolineales bacterium]|nr:polysaccharide deacetylase family protein [Anaerolineales bacterium]
MNCLRWSILIGMLVVLALACNFPTSPPARITPAPSAIPSPAFTPTPTAAPAVTSPETPPASPASESGGQITATSAPSWTPAAGEAPRFDPIEVRFVIHGSRDLPYVALTFDLCQKPEYPAGFDEGIYAALITREAPATFFMGGDWMRTHPDETRRLAANPRFELGNHSWSHPDLDQLGETAISAEILRTQDLLFQLTGRQNRLFRLPSGIYTDQVLSVIAAHGMYTIQWEVVTADPVPDNLADNILRIVQAETQNGSIIIMHANGRGWHTAEALPEMIDYLRAEGYTLVTVSQLIGLEPVPTP